MTMRGGCGADPRRPCQRLHPQAVARVAAGRRSGYVSDGFFVENLHYAAGIGLCRRAGCVVTNLDGGPLEASRGLVFAAYVETHRRLVDMVRPYFADVVQRST